MVRFGDDCRVLCATFPDDVQRPVRGNTIDDHVVRGIALGYNAFDVVPNCLTAVETGCDNRNSYSLRTHCDTSFVLLPGLQLLTKGAGSGSMGISLPCRMQL